MKVKRGSMTDKIDINMTPMIDVVFQLLTFFLFSLKTVDTEGMFNIKMPSPSSKQNLDELDPKIPVPLILTADRSGWLIRVEFNKKSYSVPAPTADDNTLENLALAAPAFNSVHAQVLGMFGTSGPGKGNDQEIELDCSPNLKYSYVIQAINAVSGDMLPNNEVRPLLERIKFKPRVGG